MARLRRSRSRGFTLIELMIVISIMLILIAIAVPAYNQSIIRAKESVLRQNLFTLRSIISQYTLDKQKAPQSLDDLIHDGYLKGIPEDPMTHSKDTWVTDTSDAMYSLDETEPGINDVHSGSDAIGSDGQPYSSW